MTTRWLKFIFLGKILVVILPVILLLVLIKRDLVLDGRLEFFTDFLRPIATITELFPADRVISTDNNTRKIVKEPIYFEVRLPQSFENAELEITYKTAKLPLLQVGLMTGEDNVWSYDFHPLFNEFLNNLDWFKLEFPNGTLWQRDKRFLSWSGFEREINHLAGLATYFNQEIYNLSDAMVTPDVNYFLSNYQTPIAVENGFKISKINFELKNANIVNRKLRFAISAPELNNGEGELSIKSIKVVLTKKPLTTQELVAKAIKYFKERF